MKSNLKRKVLGIIPFICIIFVIALFVIARLYMDGIIGPKEPVRVYYSSPIIPADNGNAYIPPIDGRAAIELKGKKRIINVVPTPDWKNIVVLEEDGSLYVTDTGLSRHVSVADNCYSILSVFDEGFLYKDSKGISHRHLFSDGSTLSLGKLANYLVSKERFSIVFADKKQGNYDNKYQEGTVNILLSSSSEILKIGPYTSKYVNFLAIADYGTAFTCQFIDDLSMPVNSRIIYYNLNDTGTSYPFDAYAFGEHAQKVSRASKGYYVLNNRFNYLYWVEDISIRPQSAPVVLSDIQQHFAIGDTLYYLDSTGDLYSAAANKTVISDKKKIDSNVCGMNLISGTVSSEPYLCYGKDYQSETSDCDLYVYEPGSQPVKINSHVEIFDNVIYNGKPFGDLRIIGNGKTIYYFANSSQYRVQDPGLKPVRSLRTLTKYTLGEKNSVVISTDVYADSLLHGIKSEESDCYPFVFQKYIETDSLGYKHYSWVSYDGTDCSTFINDTVDVAELYFQASYKGDGTQNPSALLPELFSP